MPGRSPDRGSCPRVGCSALPDAAGSVPSDRSHLHAQLHTSVLAAWPDASAGRPHPLFLDVLPDLPHQRRQLRVERGGGGLQAFQALHGLLGLGCSRVVACQGGPPYHHRPVDGTTHSSLGEVGNDPAALDRTAGSREQGSGGVHVMAGGAGQGCGHGPSSAFGPQCTFAFLLGQPTPRCRRALGPAAHVPGTGPGRDSGGTPLWLAPPGGSDSHRAQSRDGRTWWFAAHDTPAPATANDRQRVREADSHLPRVLPRLISSSWRRLRGLKSLLNIRPKLVHP